MTSIRSVSSYPASMMVWLPLLVGIYGVPGTGALRTFLLLLGISHLIWLRRTVRTRLQRHDESIVPAILWLLTAWLLIHPVLLAPEPAAAFKMVVLNWGNFILMVVVGVALARIPQHNQWLATGLFSGAFIHVLFTYWILAVSLAANGQLVYSGGDNLLGNYALASSFTSAAFAWLLADGVSRIWHGRGLFFWPTAFTVVMIVMTLFAEIQLKAKTGQLMAVILIATSGLILLLRRGAGKRWSIALFAAGVAVISLVTLGTGSRWHSFDASVRTAWQKPIPVQALINDAVPIPSGLDHSSYVRTIRYRVGIEGISQTPLGLGFTTDVYKRYVTNRFGIPEAINSSNSGLIDFTLASGLPGLCLLLTLVGALMLGGMRAFLGGNPAGIALVLLVLQFTGRYTLDGTLAGSRLTGFGLVVGVLWALSTIRDADNSTFNAPCPS